MKFSYITLSTTIAALSMFSLSCDKKKESINADELFQETEQALHSSYIFFDNNKDEIISEMYSASLKQLNSEKRIQLKISQVINYPMSEL